MRKNGLSKGISTDAAALMTIKLVTMCLGLVVTRLLSQYLSTHDYGTYAQVQLIISTVSSLTILGMVDGVNFFFCSVKDTEKREAYVATLFSLQCIFSTIAGCVVFFLRRRIGAGFENPDVEELIFFAAIFPLLHNLIAMLQILVVSIGKARMIAVRNLLVAVARFALVIVIVSVIQNVAIILTSVMILDLAQIIFSLVILYGNNCWISIYKTDFSLVKSIFTYCIPMAAFIMVNSLNRDCDKYLIAFFTDSETMAIYANASKVLPFDIIMTSFCTVLQPKITRQIAQKEYERVVLHYRIFLEIAYISTGILCGAALTAAPELMELLYSEKYLEGLPVFCVYILVDLLRFTNITMLLSAAGKTAKLMLVAVGALLTNACLNVVLFSFMGILGPAVATLLTTIGTGVIMLHLSAKELGQKVHDFFDGRFLLRFAAEGIAAVFIFGKVREILAAYSLHYVVILIVICGIYCGCLALKNGKRLFKNIKYINAV